MHTSRSFSERKTTSLFRLVQTNRIANRLYLSLNRRNHFNFIFIYYSRHFLHRTHFSSMLSEEQNNKYKVSILRVKRKSKYGYFLLLF